MPITLDQFQFLIRTRGFAVAQAASQEAGGVVETPLSLPQGTPTAGQVREALAQGAITRAEAEERLVSIGFGNAQQAAAAVATWDSPREPLPSDVAGQRRLGGVDSPGQPDGRVRAGEGARDIAAPGTGVPQEFITPGGARPGPAFSPFGETAQERATAFQGLLGERFPGGISRGVEQALANQFVALSPGFEALRGLGAIPAGTAFPTFLAQNIGQTGFDPRAVAGQAAALFGRTDLTPTQTAFRASLQEDPRAQFNLALQAGLQGLPGFLAPTFRDVAERRFGQFQTGVPLDPTTGQPAFAANPFLPQFIAQGGF